MGGEAVCRCQAGTNAGGQTETAIAGPCQGESGMRGEPSLGPVDPIAVPEFELDQCARPPLHVGGDGIDGEACHRRQIREQPGEQLLVVEVVD